MKRSLEWAMAAGTAVLLAVVVVSAQEKRDAQDPNKQKKAGDSRASTSRSPADSQLVTWIATDNEGEVVLGKFAAERSQNDQVKKFAQQMVKDHGEFLNKLRDIAPIAATGQDERRPTARRDETRPDDPTKKRSETAQTRPGEDTIRRGYLDPEGRVDLARMKQEIGRQCIETAKKELDEKSGAEFDKCYMGQQIMAHLQVADTIKVMKNYASPELRKLLEDGEKAVQGHLDQAKEIMKQLDK